MVHGAFASLHTFEAWVEHFKKSYRVTTLDLPGFGYTGAHPQRKYDLTTYISFFDEFFDKLNIRECILAGNSLGGMLCWEYALVNQPRIKKLILIDAVGFVTKWPMPLPFQLVKNIFFCTILKFWMPKFVLKKSLKDVYHDKSKITPEIVARYYELFILEGNHLAFADFVRQKIMDNSDQLYKLAVPTLILWGRQDKWIPIRVGTLFANSIPNSELIIYDKCGHIPMEEIPEQSIIDVEIFLRN
jgi:pimeloyl-ACP methyl ester carboxylesterase